LKLIISEAAGFPGGLVRFGRTKASPFALAIADEFLKSRVRLGANHTANRAFTTARVIAYRRSRS
jgi:hypothetical protein